MRKNIKRLLIIFLMFLTLCGTATIVFADGESPGGNADGADGGNATKKFLYGPRARWSGELVYIVDETGALVTGVKVVYSQSTRIDESINYLTNGSSRFAGNVVYKEKEGADVVDGTFKWGPPYGTDREANGDKIKEALLSYNYSEEDFQLICLVEDYWGTETARQFVENDWYLIMEPFYWFMYYEEYEPTGIWLLGTAMDIAQSEIMLGNPTYGPANFRVYTNQTYPCCCMLETSQLGITAAGATPDRYITNQDIINYGYGIMIYWVEVQEEEDDETGEEEEISDDEFIKELYKIRNYSNKFDVSVAIPSTEYVINEMQAKKFFIKTPSGEAYNTVVKNIPYRTTVPVTYDVEYYTYDYMGKREVPCENCMVNGEPQGIIKAPCDICGGLNISEECKNCGSTDFDTVPGERHDACNGTGFLPSETTTEICPDCDGDPLYYECRYAGCPARLLGDTNKMRPSEWIAYGMCCNLCGDSDDTYDYYCETCKGHGKITIILEGEECDCYDGYVTLPEFKCLKCGGTEYAECIFCDDNGISTSRCPVCDGLEVVEEDYWEWVLHTSTRSTNLSISLMSQISYQYLNNINIYSFKELAVTNLLITYTLFLKVLYAGTDRILKFCLKKWVRMQLQ